MTIGEMIKLLSGLPEDAELFIELIDSATSRIIVEPITESCEDQTVLGYIITETDMLPDTSEIGERSKRSYGLKHELLDLITLMPDAQTQEIIDYIAQLREIRTKVN